MKYLRPLGSVPVRTAVSNGIVSRRFSGACARTAATVVNAKTAAMSAERRVRVCINKVPLLFGGFLRRRGLGVLALRRLPVDAARVLHQPRDLFGIANPLMVRLAEAMRLAREADEAHRHAAILEPLVVHHALADGIGRVALAVQQQR